MRLALAAVAIACGTAWAQPPAPANTPDSVRHAARADKRGLVERNMDLNREEARHFWPLYDAYQKDLDRIVQRQNRALLDYVNQESSMSEANAKRIAREIVSADVDEIKLRDKYLGRMLGVLPPKKAVRFLQIENKIRTLQRYDIAEQMPLVR